ncbi:MAG TPA: hypothetical protein VH000_04715 [Rhizomicrobium sp.]|jgi:hypothetical protein|nr:hypothetical protein [Rhizomicrobium sp.]
MPKVARVAGVAIALLWLASLALPVFTTCRPGYDHVEGWFLLAFGWWGIMAYTPAWFANFGMVILSLLLIIRGRAPIWLGILTGAIAATAWFFTDWYDDTGAVPICQYHAGYWLWFGAAAIALIAPFLPRLEKKAV